MTEIKVPTLGESVTEATVAKWLKKVGDVVVADEALAELETDKVTLEVNAPQAGFLGRILVAEGQTVGVGTVLGEIAAEGVQAVSALSAPVPSVVEVVSKNEESASVVVPQNGPAARKMMADHHVAPSSLVGSGKDGRITKEDVSQHLAVQQTKPSVLPSVPRIDSPREERVKMTRLRQSIAKRLKEAQNTAAMLTTFNEIDMSAVLRLRATYQESFEKQHKVKLGFMSFFVKAAVQALKEFPALNAEIDGDDIIYKNYYDLSIAVSTPQGLIVPVVKACDTKSMAQIEKDIADLGTRARDGKITIEEMKGGTFTITNGGIFGSLMSTPILNTPQVAILGMHKIEQRPVVLPDGSIVARPMMYVAMSYDHRIVDGKEAVSFLVRIKNAIEDPTRIVLDV